MPRAPGKRVGSSLELTSRSPPEFRAAGCDPAADILAVTRSLVEVYHRPMTRVATIPAEGDQLCEGCGYVLNGLPAGSRCPECGKPADESSPALRHPPAWELPERPGGPLAAFLRTTAELLLRPTRFFRTLTPAVQTARGARSVNFARIHWAIAGVLLGSAAWA